LKSSGLTGGWPGCGETGASKPLRRRVFPAVVFTAFICSAFRLYGQGDSGNANAGYADAPAAPGAVFSGSRDKPRVALTFDACPVQGQGGSYDRGIIDLLIRTQTRATLFLSGKWMRDHTDETRDLSGNPLFELGNHSFSHPHLGRLTNQKISEELKNTQDLLFRMTGRTARFFRPPYGESDPRIERIAGETGLVTVLYDLASGDPDTAASGIRLVRHVLRHARNGSIIVFHMNGRGWHTAEALPEIIRRLREKGFSLCTVGEITGN